MKLAATLCIFACLPFVVCSILTLCFCCQGDDGLPVPGCWNKVGWRIWCHVVLRQLPRCRLTSIQTRYQLTFVRFFSCSDDNLECLVWLYIGYLFFYIFRILLYLGEKVLKKRKKDKPNVFVQIVYFNTYDSFYVLDLYTLHYFSIMTS